MKSFFLLVYLKLLNALFVTTIKKQLGISLSLLCCKGVMEWFKHFFWKPAFFVWIDATGCLFRIYRKTFRRLQITESFTTDVYLYKSRFYGFVWLKSLLLKIKKINCLEKEIADVNANKHKFYLFNWNKTDNHLIAYN